MRGSTLMDVFITPFATRALTQIMAPPIETLNATF